MTWHFRDCFWHHFHFNSHPHEEDDNHRLILLCGCAVFQLTSSRRGWPIRKNTNIITTVFQLTSSRRGWREYKHAGNQRGISTHILTKRMTEKAYKTAGMSSFQLTSSRRGWRKHLWITTRVDLFQLTSSRRGWRCRPCLSDRFLYISTHILTKRMTTRPSREQWKQQHFNSHPHEEDDSSRGDLHRRTGISTHILTKRMTCRDRRTDTQRSISTHILTKRMTFPVRSLYGPPCISTHILTKRMTAILNKNNLFKIAYYISNKHFISIVDIFFHFHIYF